MADRTPSRPGRPSSTGRPGGSARSAGARPAARSSSAASSTPSARRSPATRPGQARPGAVRASRPGAGKERPALAARPRTPQATPPSASTAWVRGAILLGILVMLAVTIVPTLRSLVQQRGDAAAMADKVAAQRETVQQLQHEAALWKDPAYIEVQARERLKFVRVGDRAYTVIDGDSGARSAPAAPRPVVAAPMANAASPWYGKVWQSIQIADRPTAGVTRTK
ncbi:MAG TPA: septum formation initiator family protein [Terrabacter sp.]|nr:septum formation initiator family protein [Terrabacter sp.]